MHERVAMSDSANSPAVMDNSAGQVARGRGRAPLVDGKFTLRQKRFIEYYVELGGRQEAAAIAAGYAKTAARGWAGELLKRDDVTEAIYHLTSKRFRQIGAKAFKVLEELAVKARSETVRSACARDLADRSGHKPVERVQIRAEIDITQIDAHIQALLLELGQHLPALSPELRALLPKGFDNQAITIESKPEDSST